MASEPTPIDQGAVYRILNDLKRARDEGRLREPTHEELRVCNVSNEPPPVVTVAGLLEFWEKFKPR